jgi:hypothetical protein
LYFGLPDGIDANRSKRLSEYHLGIEARQENLCQASLTAGPRGLPVDGRLTSDPSLTFTFSQP